MLANALAFANTWILCMKCCGNAYYGQSYFRSGV